MEKWRDLRENEIDLKRKINEIFIDVGAVGCLLETLNPHTRF